MEEEVEKPEVGSETTEGDLESFSREMEAQFLAALLGRLRADARPWWGVDLLKELWPPRARFEHLDDQPELRAKITHELTGLAMGAARSADPEFQADLVERVLEAGDVTSETWESAFDTETIATHGPRARIWQAFRQRFPWDTPESADRALLAWLLEQLLEERDGTSIMTPLYVRSAIDVRVWQESIPLEIRVQVDGRRLRRELEGKPFTCSDELSIVRIPRIVDHVPLESLRAVFDALERVLQGLADEGAESNSTKRTRSRGRAQA